MGSALLDIASEKRLFSRGFAASWSMAYYGGGFSLHLLECPACGATSTWLKKCRAKRRSVCRHLPCTHTHHACTQCGHVWVTSTWRN